MFGYFLLIIVTLILWGTAYKFSGYDLFTPVSLFLIGLLLSLILATVGFASWNNVELTGQTVGLIVLGELAFAVTALITFRVYCKKRIQEVAGASVKIKTVSYYSYETPVWKYIVLIAILLIAIIVRIYETYKIGYELGLDTGSYFSLSHEIREKYAIFMSSEAIKVNIGYSFIERQLEKVFIAVAYVGAFLLAKQIIKRSKMINLILSIAVVGMSFLLMVIINDRGDILYVTISIFVFYALLAYREGRSPLEVSRTVVKYILCIALIGIVAFYLLSFLMKRASNGGFIDYISFYFGCPIPGFQRIIDSGIQPNEIPASYTFYYLYAFGYKIGLIEHLQNYSLSWVQFGEHFSNVFTCFARYYFDFGVLGMICLTAIASCILTLIYCLARYEHGLMTVMITGYLTPLIFDMAREEFIFSRIISVNYIMIIIIIILTALFCNKKFSIRMNGHNKKYELEDN